MFANNGPGFVLSIRTKGLIVFAALMAYSVVLALFAFHQKNLLLYDFEEIQRALETETMLKQADGSTFHALMTIFTHIEASDHAVGMQRVQMHRQSLLQQHAALTGRLPNASWNVVDLNVVWDQANKDSSTANLRRLIVALFKTRSDIAMLTEWVQESRKSLSKRYRAQSDSVAMGTLLLGMLA